MNSRNLSSHSFNSAQRHAEGVIPAVDRQQAVVLVLVLIISLLVLTQTGSGYV